MKESISCDVAVAHTSLVDGPTLDAARSLLEAIFEGDFADDDWEHALGGIHALARYDGQLVGHASVIQRRLLHRGRALRAGYVEGVGVRPDLQGRGIGSALMRAIENVIAAAYDIGALGATDEALQFYEHRGWRRWQGPTSALTPDGMRRTSEEDGFIFVLDPTGLYDLTAPLACDWRDGDVW